MKRRLVTLGLLLSMTVVAVFAALPPAAAQGDFERVELEAADGLVLVGNYYAQPEGEELMPAVLLAHHGSSRKEAWIDFIPVVYDAGYAVLTIDQRGHGDTGGGMVPELGKNDILLWLEWLRDQPGVDPDRVSIVGASLGADLGLLAMAEDERVPTLVGISVLTQIEDIDTASAVEAIGERPLFLIGGQRAGGEAEAIHTLLPLAAGDIQVRLYDTTACCTFLIMMNDDLAPAIIDWLNTHG
ncbi:MAG: alpha/beta fold hydrolase [Chloroflexi bacterium]|nr:alpha/beta fold hydrolase [Chloroflexota bacterium]